MSNDSNQAKLGRAGETIVTNYFNKQGALVEASVDQYDSEKDMLIDGKKIEVKTQVPFVMKNAFTIKSNQLKKCLSVDKVFFVSVPNATRKHFSDGKVYSIESEKLVYENYTTKDGRNMILIPIDQMKEEFALSDNEKSVLQRYSVSGWN